MLSTVPYTECASSTWRCEHHFPRHLFLQLWLPNQIQHCAAAQQAPSSPISGGKEVIMIVYHSLTRTRIGTQVLFQAIPSAPAISGMCARSLPPSPLYLLTDSRFDSSPCLSGSSERWTWELSRHVQALMGETSTHSHCSPLQPVCCLLKAGLIKHSIAG